jgi:hypothetical protein
MFNPNIALNFVKCSRLFTRSLRKNLTQLSPLTAAALNTSSKDSRNKKKASLNPKNLSSEQQLQSELRNLLSDLQRGNSFATYDEELVHRRSQARRSILFTSRYCHPRTIDYLIDDCLTIGAQIKDIHVFAKSAQSDMKSILIEFKTDACVNNILKHYTTNFETTPPFAFATRVLYYLPANRNGSYFKSRPESFNTSKARLTQASFDTTSLTDLLANGSALNLRGANQIEALYDRFRIDDSSSRMRFFVASLVEEVMSGLLKGCICLPFGSSTNRFGARQADLDLGLAMDASTVDSLGEICAYEKNSKKEGDEAHVSPPGKLFGSFKFMSNMNNQLESGKKFLYLVEFVLSRMLPKFRVIDTISGKLSFHSYRVFFFFFRNLSAFLIKK